MAKGTRTKPKSSPSTPSRVDLERAVALGYGARALQSRGALALGRHRGQHADRETSGLLLRAPLQLECHEGLPLFDAPGSRHERLDPAHPVRGSAGARDGPGGFPELGARDLCQSVVIPTMVPGAVGEALSTSARIARRSTSFFSECDGGLSRVPGAPWPEVGGGGLGKSFSGRLSQPDPARNGTTQARIAPLTDRNELKTGNWPSCASGLRRLVVGCGFFQIMQVSPIILFGVKTRLAIIIPLHNMLRNSR
jgi:hypothetical protein